MNITHDEIVAFLGIPKSKPAPDWLPYAVRATRVEVLVDGERLAVWGAGMRCGQCGFGVDMLPGPGSGTQHPEPSALLRCPKCEYAGPPAPRTAESANV
jgi:hypothetical protein